MDMKLNGQRIKALRLQRSWSQEQLADAAGLNQRTIQRVETEGSGSLRTRKALAMALDLDPAALDALATAQPTETQSRNITPASSTLWGKCQVYLASRNSYQFILLILLTVFYFASQPFYFSFSRTSFSWINFMLGGPLIEIPLWWASVIIFWLLFAVPWLLVVAKKYRQYLSWHITTMMCLLLLSVARLWQPALIMEAITFGLYYCTLLLLAFQFLNHPLEEKVRQSVILFLGCYIFFWFFHALSQFFLRTTLGYFRYGRELWPLSFWGRIVLGRLADLVQLLPVVMVLLFSLQNKRSPGVSNRHSQQLSPQAPGENGDGQNSFFQLARSWVISCRFHSVKN